MAEARQRDNWNHTAAVMALLVNINRDPKKSRPAKPADFHPMVRRRKAGMDWDLLRKTFVPEAK